MKKSYAGLFDLRGRIAVVTGAFGLIGREIAEVLADFGAKVYSADLLAVGRLPAAGRTRFVPMDITSESSVQKTLSRIHSREKRIDILVNCAYPRTSDWGMDMESVPMESWHTNVNSHLGGYFCVSRAAAVMMKKRRRGSIINLASIYGMVAPDFSIYKGTGMTMPAAYAAIKGGIISISRYMAAYYGKWNIRVNVISPGGVFDSQHPAFVRAYTAKTPLERMAAPRDVAAAALYLAADASSYVTGLNLPVDGGRTIL
jgi:NAD(P)-dependent dehydrogenase (short-subunit alcohol dehydrogenase family)